MKKIYMENKRNFADLDRFMESLIWCAQQIAGIEAEVIPHDPTDDPFRRLIAHCLLCIKDIDPEGSKHLFDKTNPRYASFMDWLQDFPDSYEYFHEDYKVGDWRLMEKKSWKKSR